MRDILSDHVGEQQFLDQSLQRIPIKVWDLVTPNKPWTVRDTIAHLADFEDLGADALQGGARIKEWQAAADIEPLRQKPIKKGRGMRHVCWFGWKTLPYAFKQAGEHYEPVRVEVIGPGYSKWVYGPEDTDQLIKGSASDWARLVVRRGNPKELRLKVTGDHAEKACALAQTYL